MTAPTTSTATTTGRTRGRGDGGVLLADALSVNALTSGTTGLVLAGGAPWLDEVLGVHAGLLAVVGLGLVAFGALILAALARPTVLRSAARQVVAADIAWVVGAALVVPADVLTTVGDVVLAGISVVVAGFAAAKVVGLRRAGTSDAVGTRPFELAGARDVPAPPDVAWQLVADAAGYAELAPGIARTTTDGDLAPGMQRVCVDDGGRSWSETCTSLEPGRAYRMQVDTSTYPLRHRAVLHSLGMAWRVIPTASGSRLVLRFSGRAKLGVVGRAALAALERDDPATRILDACAARLGAGR